MNEQFKVGRLLVWWEQIISHSSFLYSRIIQSMLCLLFETGELANFESVLERQLHLRL